MKKIIYLLLLLLATSNSLCACGHRNPPYDPNGRIEGSDPTVNNQDETSQVCEDYYNRYLLVDNVNIFLSDRGTLYWYNATLGSCPKICWADLSLHRDGYFIRVYRLIHGEMREVEVLDTRTNVNNVYDILICDTSDPDFLYPRKVRVCSSSGHIEVLLISTQDYFKADERFYM